MEEYVKLSLTAFKEMQDKIKEKENLQKELDFIKENKNYKRVYLKRIYLNTSYEEIEILSNDLVVSELHSRIVRKDNEIDNLKSQLKSIPNWVKKLLCKSK